MDLAAVVVGLLGLAGGGVGTAWVQGIFARRRESAQITQITAAAHSEIYAQYGTLLKELRQDAELAREESRGARAEAREAQLRASEAEARAAGAETRATAAESQLAEMRRLVQQYVPDAEALMMGFAKLARAKETRDAAAA